MYKRARPHREEGAKLPLVADDTTQENANAVMFSDLTKYQLCFLNAGGTTVRRENFQFSDDQSALAHSKQSVDGLALELRSGARLVGRMQVRKWAPKIGSLKSM